jgi:ABC-type glycerol-3-phosphate transport system permease component
MVAASFMPTGEANSFPPRFLPSRPTLTHYVDLFTRRHHHLLLHCPEKHLLRHWFLCYHLPPKRFSA